MLKKRSKTLLYTSPVGIVILFLLIIFEVKVPHSITTYFEVNPVQKWGLIKGTSGQLTSNIIDYESAVSNDLTVVQFDRGESMNFKLSPTLMSRKYLVKGDTIGIIYSSRVLERLAELNGGMLVARANLAALSVGEKRELIDEAGAKVKYTEAKIQEQKLLFERAAELLKRGYISQVEYEAAQWNLKQAEIENEVNKAQLDVLLSGSKDEDLAVIRSKIDSYNVEIRLLNERLKDFVLTAPISGEIIKNFSADTLLLVNNTSQLILVAPIRYENVRYLKEGDRVTLELMNIPGTINGRLSSISREVKNLNGVQILYSRIALDSARSDLVPGLSVGGEIILPKVPIKEYLLSVFGI